jgi:hypothetical protein
MNMMEEQEPVTCRARRVGGGARKDLQFQEVTSHVTPNPSPLLGYFVWVWRDLLPTSIFEMEAMTAHPRQ